jgi:hypothetical protein
MNNEVQANADAENTARLQSNASLSEFAKFRAHQLMGQQQEEVQEEQPQAEETEVVDEVNETEEPIEETQESTEETETQDVLSNIDLDNLSENELRELSDKLGSRAVLRFGELTAKRKQAEAELAELRQKLQESDNPLKGNVDQSRNPYRNVESIEELQKIAQDVDSIVEWAEDTIFNAEGYGADDVVTEVNGKEYTKAEVRKKLLDARKAEKKFLPAQLKILQDKEYAKQAKNSLTEKAKEEFGWIGKEGDELNEKYKAMLDDPRLEGLEEFSPELAAQLPYLLAHSANSLYGRKVIPQDAPVQKKGVQLDPPSSMPGSAKSEKQISNALKSIKESQQAFRETGSKDDFIKLRTLRYSQQQ